MLGKKANRTSIANKTIIMFYSDNEGKSSK